MLYITFLVLTYFITGSLYLWTTFIQFPIPPPPTSVNHKSDLLFYEFVCLFVFEVKLTYNTMLVHSVGIQYFLDFKLITTISLITICHIQRYYIITDYIPYTVHFISMAHLFCNWKFVPQSPSPISLLLPPPLQMVGILTNCIFKFYFAHSFLWLEGFSCILL